MSQTNAQSSRMRSGISSSEFLVSFAVMVVVMTLVTSLTFHVSQIWRDVEQDRLAMSELSNQLDSLTRQSPQNLIEQTKKLKPSAFCTEGLPNPRLTAKLNEDELGQRIDLTLAWDHRLEPRKIHLSGWAIETKSETAENSQTPETDAPETDAQDDPKADPTSDAETEPNPEPELENSTEKRS